ncbi:MAG: hypothetical protein IKR11_03210, partial [Solobacterium sp.]|nr:hypothetical protein [Solobacterium sp.]
MKKFLIMILSLFLLALPVPARADGISSPMRNAHCAVPDKNGNAVFQGLPDLNGIRSGNHTVYTLLDSGYKYEEYTGIHPQTLVWRKVSAYFFTASASVNMT